MSASQYLIRYLGACGLQDCLEHSGQLSLSHGGLRISDLKGYLGLGPINLSLSHWGLRIILVLNDRVISPTAVLERRRLRVGM